MLRGEVGPWLVALGAAGQPGCALVGLCTVVYCSLSPVQPRKH